MRTSARPLPFRHCPRRHLLRADEQLDGARFISLADIRLIADHLIYIVISPPTLKSLQPMRRPLLVGPEGLLFPAILIFF